MKNIGLNLIGVACASYVSAIVLILLANFAVATILFSVSFISWKIGDKQISHYFSKISKTANKIAA